MGGADAVRLYLINSPVVKAENLRFKEEGVQGILRDVFLPWYNAYRFLFQNIESYEQSEGVDYTWSEAKFGISSNVMDQWIISFTQSLLAFVAKEMAAYRLYTVIPRLVKFIDNLTNWYVRMNRRRLKGEGGKEDCLAALNTLFGVALTMVRIMAPFTPFLTETMYQQLRKKVPALGGKDQASVHYLMLPVARQELINEDIERAVGRMQAVVDLGRVLRDRKTMPLKYPLPEVVVIHKEKQCLEDIGSLEKYIQEELNIRKVTLSADKASYGVTLRAEQAEKVPCSTHPPRFQHCLPMWSMSLAFMAPSWSSMLTRPERKRLKVDRSSMVKPSMCGGKVIPAPPSLVEGLQSAAASL